MTKLSVIALLSTCQCKVQVFAGLNMLSGRNRFLLAKTQACSENFSFTFPDDWVFSRTSHQAQLADKRPRSYRSTAYMSQTCIRKRWNAALEVAADWHRANDTAAHYAAVRCPVGEQLKHLLTRLESAAHSL